MKTVKDSADSIRMSQVADRFLWMVAFSLLLHIGITLAVLSRTQQHQQGMAAPFLDLSMLTAPAGPAESPTFMDGTTATDSEQGAVAADPPPDIDSPYENLRKGLQETLSTAEQVPETVHQASISLGMTNGYFSMLADGHSLRPDIREYYLALLRQVNEKWWLGRTEAAGYRGPTLINLVIARDGTLVQLQLVRSSGDTDWDKTIIQTLRKGSPLPPLPESFTEEFFKAPLRFVAPLNLLTPANKERHQDSSNSNTSRSMS